MTGLNWQMVREIRDRWEAGESQSSIAEDYPCSQGLVSQIVRNNCWKEDEYSPEV